MWVPTRCQLADGLTKSAKGSDIRDQLRLGLLFHEHALKRRTGASKSTGLRDSTTGVKVQS